MFITPRISLLVFLLFGAITPGAASPDNRVIVDYWEKWSGFEADAMQSVIDDFNRTQDRIEVRLLTVSPIDVKLLLAAS